MKRAAARRLPTGAKEPAPKGFRSDQHGSAANGAGRPDGDLGQARRGRHKLDREAYARSAIDRSTTAQRAEHCRRTGERSAGPDAAAIGALRALPLEGVTENADGGCRQGKAFPTGMSACSDPRVSDFYTHLLTLSDYTTILLT